ncbi:putative multidrug resistance ABC transporter ATP-binding/permease protein YheI [Planctopirus ephydatiae]|uniref:Putative multidrug resistance ABC transporter ATP-binding/permease protein YheI n=1 Tax=Planctopirus ephydatiae TaxID=2528019 RepID=A0A518GQN1_9PLAN|nr:ATP-binding cassette domain-containing protein [Planctopirus ephydatiae]QDV30910.1 putative multidrug resistance ABC transporter ATP-binding/permease protein YheI [Planctopirus ephydatiae]
MSRLSSSTSRAEPGELRHAETDRNDYGDETECFSSGTSQGAALAGALVEFGRLTENPWEPLIVQRELEAAARCWQGDFDSKWWKWAIEVARSHGLAIRLMDLTISEVHALATHGGIALCRTEPIPTEPIPKVSAPSSKAAPELAERLFVVSGRKKTLAMEFANELYGKDLPWLNFVQSFPQVAVRCVVFEPNIDGLGAGHEHHQPPWKRLLRMIAPEKNEIWTIFLMACAAGLLSISAPLAAQQLVRAVTFGGVFQPIIVLSIILLGLLSLLGAFQILKIYISEVIQRRLFTRITADLAWRLPRVKESEWLHHDGQELVNRFLEVVTLQKVISSLLVDGLAIVLATIVGMTLMAFYHPFLLGYDLVLIVLLSIIILTMGRGGVRTSIEESNNKYMALAWFEELVRVPAIFRTPDGAALAWQRSDALCTRYLNARQTHFTIVLRQYIALAVLQAVAATALLGLGGYLVLREQLTLGQLVAAELIVATIVGSFLKLGKHLEEWFDLMAAVNKLGHLFDLPVTQQRGVLLPESRAPIALDMRNVSWGHPPGAGHWMTPHLTCAVTPGSSLAILDNQPEHRSKILSALAGEAYEFQGIIELDSLPLNDLRKDLVRSQVAFVQMPEILSASIATNVHLHRPDVSDQTVKRRLEDVALMARIETFHGGIHTELSAKGEPLSSTEQMQLMLARAMAGAPRLLLIDGWLDGLPDHLRQRLLGVLFAPDRTWTTVIATSRPDIAALCDQTIEMDNSESRPLKVPRQPSLPAT